MNDDQSSQRLEARVLTFFVHAMIAAIATAVVVKCANSLWSDANLDGDADIANLRALLGNLAFATPFIVGIAAGVRRVLGVFVFSAIAGVLVTAPVAVAHLAG